MYKKAEKLRDGLPVISQWANTAWGRKKEIEANALIAIDTHPFSHHCRSPPPPPTVASPTVASPTTATVSRREK